MPEDYLKAPSAFSEFNELTEDRHYAAIPEDWTVFVADIADSTAAIESGRYKDVNMLGAACIVAVQNAIGSESLLYTFGGDGATVLVPLAPAQWSALYGMLKDRYGVDWALSVAMPCDGAKTD